MASGSVKRLDVCKPSESFIFNKSVSANSRGLVTASAAGYTIPAGYVGAIAGFTGETNSSTNSTTPLNFISPRATDTGNFVGIRNNAASTNYTRHISVNMTFIKTEYVDDRRT